MKHAILLVFLFSMYISAQADCSAVQAKNAEYSVDYLKTWQAVYDSFKKYPGCDDGAIAEGYSDAVVKLLANHWNKFANMQKLISKDPQFNAFILMHIDATTDWDDLKAVILHASHECPKGARSLCLDIKLKATSAYEEAKSAVNGSSI